VNPLSLEAVVAALARLGLAGSLDRDAAAGLLGATARLIAYGSLAPGCRHHDELADVPGTWRSGWITGALVDAGWGSAIGYDALRWDPAGARVAAQLLESAALPASWERLDAFEGEAYRRALVPFFLDEGGWTVGQAYVLEDRPRGARGAPR